MQKAKMVTLGLLLACSGVACSGSSSSTSSGTTGATTTSTTSTTTTAAASTSGTHGSTGGSTTTTTTTGSTGSTGSHASSTSGTSGTSTSSSSSSSSSTGSTGSSGSSGSTGSTWYCPDYDPNNPNHVVYGGGNTLASDETWTPAKVYFVLGELQIGQYALTISAGTTVCFGDDPSSSSVRMPGTLRLTEGNSANTVFGKLLVEGTSTQPVTFASLYPTSDYAGIELGAYSEVNLQYLVVYRAGYDGRALDLLDYDNPQPTFSQVTFRDLVKYGVRLSMKKGISAQSSNLLVESFDPTMPEGDQLEAVAVQALAIDTLNTSNIALGIGIPAGQRIFKLTGSPYVDRSVTWRDLGAPYFTNVDLHIEKASSSQPTAPVLTVEPGVEVQLTSSADIFVGGSGAYDSSGGDLMVMGTAGLPVTFTSGEALPANGDWGAIHFSQTSYDPTVSMIDHAQLSFGGGVTSQGGAYSCTGRKYAEVEIDVSNNLDNPYPTPSITNTSFMGGELGVVAYCIGQGACSATDYTASVTGNTFTTTQAQGTIGMCP